MFFLLFSTSWANFNFEKYRTYFSSVVNLNSNFIQNQMSIVSWYHREVLWWDRTSLKIYLYCFLLNLLFCLLLLRCFYKTKALFLINLSPFLINLQNSTALVRVLKSIHYEMENQIQNISVNIKKALTKNHHITYKKGYYRNFVHH